MNRRFKTRTLACIAVLGPAVIKTALLRFDNGNRLSGGGPVHHPGIAGQTLRCFLSLQSFAGILAAAANRDNCGMRS
jgi:hypothetical protein